MRSFRAYAAIALATVALTGTASSQEISPEPAIPNWAAPTFWTPSKVSKPDESASVAEPMEVEGGVSPMPFIATVPCRVVDTRNANGPYGGPAIVGGAAARTFNIPAGPCPIPPGAGAFSINVAAILPSADGFLTVFPTGVPQPLSSDLNFLGGEVIANALIVPAGTGGSINVFANVTTDIIIDINGYYMVGALDSTYVNEGQSSSVTSGMIVDGSIVNADINASAAIADTKLATIATAGKVADTALSSNVSKLGQSIETAEIGDDAVTGAKIANGTVGSDDIANMVRSIHLPLTSFVDFESTGALLDFTSGADDRADFDSRGPNGAGFRIAFDDDVGNQDQGTEICAQIVLPTDFVSIASFKVLTAKDNHGGATEVLNCAIGQNLNFMEAPGTVEIAQAGANFTTCIPMFTFDAQPGYLIRVSFSITSSATMDNVVRLYYVEFQYQAVR